MYNPPARDSSGQQPLDGSPIDADEMTESLSNSLRRAAASTQSVFTNLNLVVSLSLLAALVTIWIDFRGAYTATMDATTKHSPVVAGLLPSILVGLTVFTIVWCVVYGWRYVQSLRAKLDPDVELKAGLKELVPDIETCLFFLEKVGSVEDERYQHRLKQYISDSCRSLWEDMQTIGLDGPTAYSLASALPFDDAYKPNVEELNRLLKTLAPLARSGNVKEARRIY